MKRENCPSRTDDRCREVIHKIWESVDLGEIDAENSDLRYFADCMIDYWGEDQFRQHYPEVSAILSSRTQECADDDDDDCNFDDDIVRH